ncbi:hypothetical protein FE783_30515 [Paenibacillus mesophilus]|uniref:hypothetical protein n=1 Tax=Paenibacillus mesophilus TaxID=2582849 RepID=UPI00110E2C16|nr:hypothetical protein [Paenibacillus mesophilus]TMV45006.1 hypothetical protein FE783_30515 [Paenibacillus mesophilus]
MAPDHGEMEQLRLRAQANARSVWNDPCGRLALRQAFYRKYGFGPGYGFGTSEIRFIEWMIRRGVLDPRGGSPWWKAVSGMNLYHAELARLACEQDAGGLEWEAPVRLWLDYMARPSECLWYRAHNSSVVRSYIEHAGIAADEQRDEQKFMNAVLSRLLYAQWIVGKRDGLKALGWRLAHPTLPVIGALLRRSAFYPILYPARTKHSPLTRPLAALDELGVHILDNILILPQASALYRQAAKWNLIPELAGFLHNNCPAYPWSLIGGGRFAS